MCAGDLLLKQVPLDSRGLPSNDNNAYQILTVCQALLSTYIRGSLNLHNRSMKWALLLFTFYR